MDSRRTSRRGCSTHHGLVVDDGDPEAGELSVGHFDEKESFRVVFGVTGRTRSSRGKLSARGSDMSGMTISVFDATTLTGR